MARQEGVLSPFLTHLGGPTAPTCLSVRSHSAPPAWGEGGLRLPGKGADFQINSREQEPEEPGPGTVCGAGMSVYKHMCVHTPVCVCAHEWLHEESTLH